ncbi:hypothetical protein BGZ72_003026 [Mortierella alpina]|nr:hypothetical protein BGZ72_003026 [Mortierella alpina]
MGLKGFYWWLRKKKGYDPILRVPTHCPVQEGAKVRLDVLSFFSRIRTIYTNYRDDKAKAHFILLEHLKKFADPAHTVYYVDGDPAAEKQATHRLREKKRNDALKTAKVAIEALNDRVSHGKPPTKEMFKQAEKGLRGGFKWTIEDRKDFVNFLRGQGIDARFCPFEADIAIAKDCQPADIVLSQDSDFFAYDTVKMLWRPVGKRDEGKVLEYDKAAVLDKIGLSSTKLTALACVSSNDYNRNIPYLGIATNYNVIKDLPDTDVTFLVQGYLESPLVVCNDQEDIDFTASVLVFTTMTQTAVQAGVTSDPPTTALPETPLVDHPALLMSSEVLYQQYESFKDQHAKTKAQGRMNSSSKSDTKPERQGRRKQFRRHRVIDRPAHQPGVSQQVHRPRYSPKTRSDPLEQEAPPICRQYEWKPYTAQQEARSKQVMAENMRKQAQKEQQRVARRRKKAWQLLKKPPPKIEDMNKMQLVQALAWEHPLVSLPVGTVKANSKRAAAAAAAANVTTTTTTHADQRRSATRQEQEVSHCILDVVEQVRVTKRQAQELLGAYIETVTKLGPTEEDRAILSTLCPAVKSRFRASPESGQGDQSSSNSSTGTSTEDESMECARDSADEDSVDQGSVDKEFVDQGSVDEGVPLDEEFVDQGSVDEGVPLDEDSLDEVSMDEDDDDEDSDDEDEDEDAEPSAMDKPFLAFYQILLGYIYSRKLKSKTVAERQVGQLIARATSLGITLPPVPQRNLSYPTVPLLETTTKQVYRSMKMMYRNGSVALEDKINSQQNRPPGTVPLKIDSALPAIENYVILNKASGGSRRIAPLSPLTARYVGFSERQLLPLFWAWPTLKAKIKSLMVEDRYFQDPTIVPAQADAFNWLTTTAPGRLITTFVSDVGLPSSKHHKGFRKATTIMDLEGMDGKEGLREHIGRLREQTFDPKDWRGKGYILRGSIRTDGRLVQLLAFKNKELQSVRFRRLPNDKLPNPLISTIGGTDRYLTEARNIFPSIADVENLLSVDPSQVAVLSLDLGTSCVVGATVSLPFNQTPATLRRPPIGKEQVKRRKKRRGKRTPGSRNRTRARQKARKSATNPQPAQYFDLVVKRKAVARPTDDFANWLEQKKQHTMGATTGRTVQDLESTLPPLQGDGSSFCQHVAARRAVEVDLDRFYNSSNFWKHRFDAQVCYKEEFHKVAEGLLNMVGGSVGRPRLPHQHVVIAVGLAKFTGSKGPPSLDSTFQGFFVNLARSLGYLVVGINEHFTSKKCPICQQFVCSTSDWRTLYYPSTSSHAVKTAHIHGSMEQQEELDQQQEKELKKEETETELEQGEVLDLEQDEQLEQE